MIGLYPEERDSIAVQRAMDKTCELVEQLLHVSVVHSESDRGLFVERGLYVVKQGSAYVMISIRHSEAHAEQVLVQLTARVVSDVRPSGDLFEALLTLNAHLRFGAFAYESKDHVVLFLHNLMGWPALDANALAAAVHDVATIADQYDDNIVAQYGGKRMQDVVEESALEHLNSRASTD